MKVRVGTARGRAAAPRRPRPSPDGVRPHSKPTPRKRRSYRVGSPGELPAFKFLLIYHWFPGRPINQAPLSATELVCLVPKHVGMTCCAITSVTHTVPQVQLQ